MEKKSGKPISVIDLFAGPGGLGEGFSAYQTPDGSRPFRIALSIEKETYAHQTLVLRSFFRQFEPRRAPEACYDYLRKVEEPEPARRRALFDAFPEQARQAESHSHCAELGKDDPVEIRERILRALTGTPDFILLGGPPCQAYSAMGRSRNWGNPNYDEATDQRQRLYVEYLQVLADHRPAVFIMGNVKGLLSATLAEAASCRPAADRINAFSNEYLTTCARNPARDVTPHVYSGGVTPACNPAGIASESRSVIRK